MRNTLKADDPKAPANRRIYQRDVAERAGVSISTVSRALRDGWGISEEVQQRVLAAAAELGYERTKETRELRSVSLLTSLPLAPALDPFHAEVLHGVELACSEKGVQLSYATFSTEGPNGDRILNRLRQNPVDGLLLLSLDDSALIEEIRRMGIPMVMLNVDRPDATEDLFLPDNYQGACLAMRYLLAHGHERIMHITQLTRRTIQRRTEAYRDVLAEAGIRYDPRRVIELEINAEETYRVMKQRLAQGELDGTAVFCANDLSAMGFMRAAQEIGLRIPRDISVIGFDDISSSAFLSPPLTTLRIETGELASLALRRLIDRVAEPGLTPIRVSLACELVERQSVRQL